MLRFWPARVSGGVISIRAGSGSGSAGAGVCASMGSIGSASGVSGSISTTFPPLFFGFRPLDIALFLPFQNKNVSQMCCKGAATVSRL
jgi:hypothetical protein